MNVKQLRSVLEGKDEDTEVRLYAMDTEGFVDILTIYQDAVCSDYNFVADKDELEEYAYPENYTKEAVVITLRV